MNNIVIQDIAAAGVSLITVAGVVYCAVAGIAIPAELMTVVGLAMGWLFRGGQAAVATKAAPPTP